MTLETRRYRRAVQLALRVAGRAATLEECRAPRSTAVNPIDYAGREHAGEELAQGCGATAWHGAVAYRVSQWATRRPAS
jgi:hypothetical protein